MRGARHAPECRGDHRNVGGSDPAADIDRTQVEWRRSSGHAWSPVDIDGVATAAEMTVQQATAVPVRRRRPPSPAAAGRDAVRWSLDIDVREGCCTVSCRGGNPEATTAAFAGRAGRRFSGSPPSRPDQALVDRQASRSVDRLAVAGLLEGIENGLSLSSGCRRRCLDRERRRACRRARLVCSAPPIRVR